MALDKLSFDSYDSICKNTAAHMDFCEKVLQHLSNNYTPTPDIEQKIDAYHWLTDNIEVAGAKFNPGKHMLKVADKSQGWDFTDADPALQSKAVDQAISLQKLSPLYNLISAVDGMPYVISVELKRDVNAELLPSAIPRNDTFVMSFS